ncbi:hypothetical protein [Mesorhizobium sp. M2A.F.Ca.ET.039.01.1.1]|uniref:hypothetical protein n=1 Tax=Mesorhizobium sp. M2A.F.Ca.ET.039.01.1.1 TaxID=2496746 RepID=UPI000FCC3787|nr:hypothetical protein [Mesorhizobium sp. M2A.F.Ca.ET.039.01.1.1]RWX72527.1 hypothetical protein EOA24_00610 [Mesorhizobium sp. M2A.F.Ca.ET.039.01.1.1]
MLHARPDYDRIQDPAGLIPEAEPVFLLRGQDKHAARLLRLYARAVRNDGGDEQLAALVEGHADRMDAWPVKKSPDL